MKRFNGFRRNTCTMYNVLYIDESDTLIRNVEAECTAHHNLVNLISFALVGGSETVQKSI